MSRILFIVLLSLAALAAGPVWALTVSPAKVEISADPGQTVVGEIELFNEQTEAKIFFTSFENFESRGDSGAPYFIGAQGGLASWLRTEPEISIQPGERIAVPYTIEIPSGTKPGGYFAAIFLGNEPPGSGGGGEVTIGGKVGVLLLLSVNGLVEESAGLTGFGTRDGRRFFVNLPVAFEYGFNNTGGNRVVPHGDLSIKNTFRLTSTTLSGNPHEGSVLPNSTRRFEVLWGEKSVGEEEGKEKLGFFATVWNQLTAFHFGWYTGRLDLTWGTSQRASAIYHFYILPWQLLSVAFAILFLMWLLFKIWAARFRRRILAEATKSKGR